MSSDRDAFSAIGDQTRRSILELLRDHEPLTAGDIAARFPDLSRPAVSKHLGVLRQAGLVHADEVGREWHYRLDPRPLADMYEQWFGPFASLWEPSLQHLKQQAEGRGATPKGKRRA